MSIEIGSDLTSLLNSTVEDSVIRRYDVDVTLKNIYGEHNTREQIIHQQVYDVTDDSTSEEKQSTEKKTKKRSSPREVHTFPKDVEGNLLIPFGGIHGYLMGALRVSIKDIFGDKTRDKNWEGYGIGKAIDHGVTINPEWISLGKVISNPLENPKTHLVKTAGISQSMISVYYDTVIESNIHLTIDFTNKKIPEKLFLQLLAHTQLLGISPKGRGSIKITKLIKTKG